MSLYIYFAICLYASFLFTITREVSTIWTNQCKKIIIQYSYITIYVNWEMISLKSLFSCCTAATSIEMSAWEWSSFSWTVASSWFVYSKWRMSNEIVCVRERVIVCRIEKKKKKRKRIIRNHIYNETYLLCGCFQKIHFISVGRFHVVRWIRARLLLA